MHLRVFALCEYTTPWYHLLSSGQKTFNRRPQTFSFNALGDILVRFICTSGCSVTFFTADGATDNLSLPDEFVGTSSDSKCFCDTIFSDDKGSLDNSFGNLFMGFFLFASGPELAGAMEGIDLAFDLAKQISEFINFCGVA
mmetsp:Transcript_35479/g.49257  ORF Transcript_35479/g.49257 Transcript_35479/m.49257 type:complete len:141 (-) Transcript_35479:1101-1523(-)